MPTSIVKRDQYGNPKRTEIKALVRGLNKPEGTRGSAFVGRPDQGDRPFGVYKVVRKGSLRAYFIAQQGTSYGNPLAGIYSKANARAKQTFGPYLRQFLAQAVAENVKSGRATCAQSVQVKRGSFWLEPCGSSAGSLSVASGTSTS